MRVYEIDHVQLAMPAGGEEFVERLSDAGCAVPDDDLLEGFDRVYVDDPFGHRIELMEPDA